MPALAFGPGLNVEGALFRACDGPKQSGAGRKTAAAGGGEGKEEKKVDREEKTSGVEVGSRGDLHNNTGLL